MTIDKSANVYIVDDDCSVRRSLARVIRSANLHAATFATAEEFFQSNYEIDNSCLVVDAKMPGSNGLNMLSRLRNEHIAIPVIVVTAHDDSETRADAEAAGAIGFFRKPVDAEALLDAITWALSRKEKTKLKTD